MRLSYSSINTFKQCERLFYYKYIMKTEPTEVNDMKYADFGNCVHKMIENLDNFENIDEEINFYWNEYDLEGKFDKNDIIKCLNYCKSLELPIIKKEEQIHLDYEGQSFIAIIDAILEDHTIVDWKTSTYTSKKLKEYEEQTKFYAWIYYKKYKIIPPKVMVVFCKSGKVFEKKITINDINEMENNIKKIILTINSKINFNDFRKTNNCKWCNYKRKCWEDTFKNDKNICVKVILKNNRLIINTEKFLLEKINNVLDKQLSYEIDNAHYVIKAMKQKGINFDGIIHLYKNNSTYLGFKNYIIDLLRNDLNEYLENRGYKLNLKIIDERKIPNKSANINCDKLKGIELRDYQKEAIDHIIKDEISLTELCVGSGKTVMAAEIIRRLNYKTLFVVDVSVLLKQTKDEFERLLGIEVGLITNGEQNWKDINVATIQTVVKFLNNKDKEFMKNLHECNVIIVDEAHCSKSKSYNKLMSNITAKYRIGLTGTAYSNGNDSLELYKSFGFPTLKIKLKDLVDRGYLVKPIIKFIKYNMNKGYYYDYDEAYTEILGSKERLNKVKEIIEKHINDNILIITRRLEHADKINEVLGGDVEIIKGSLNKKKRDKFIKEMKEGKRKILIGTDKIVQKGLNIPNLNVLINYSANKGSIQTIQSLGRVIRKCENKECGYYYDFYDEDENLINATKERIKALKYQGFKVEIGDKI